MPINSDFIKYHKSISVELKATQDRIRNLIGSKHWPTDGEHKEAILRKVLKGHLPEVMKIGRGFVCYRQGPSTQLDIMVTNCYMPTLFKDGDLMIVSSDNVEAIIEVKTKLESPKEIQSALDKLATQVSGIRNAKRSRDISENHSGACWAGLFIFDAPRFPTGDRRERAVNRKAHNVLQCLSQAAITDPSRAINCVSLGADIFFRYWPKGTIHIGGSMREPGWQSYYFNRSPHKGLSPAYFIGNLVIDITPEIYHHIKYFWFPIQDSYGKEQYRMHSIGLGSSVVQEDQFQF